jgi:hypothetical protein
MTDKDKVNRPEPKPCESEKGRKSERVIQDLGLPPVEDTIPMPKVKPPKEKK